MCYRLTNYKNLLVFSTGKRLDCNYQPFAAYIQHLCKIQKGLKWLVAA